MYEKIELKPGRLYADSAYDTKEVRLVPQEEWAKANIPVNKRNRLKPRRERHTAPMRRCLERLFANRRIQE